MGDEIEGKEGGIPTKSASTKSRWKCSQKKATSKSVVSSQRQARQKMNFNSGQQIVVRRTEKLMRELW